jgi:hypothetical protein
MNRDLAYSSTSRQLGYLAASELWNKIPPFEYRSPSLGWAITQHVWSLAALGCWLVLGVVSLTWAISVMRVE